ncbi:unnamed protein product [Ambrosiozyma monospora]|uniref:Unnamed protein product n=1 Tax=Ambrosiozyma monospora TaxID=43982 RepID=A0A9W6Z7C3_AMBMO|nr:unnamed protein product [Ambrosiozyma monospora]
MSSSAPAQSTTSGFGFSSGPGNNNRLTANVAQFSKQPIQQQQQQQQQHQVGTTSKENEIAFSSTREDQFVGHSENTANVSQPSESITARNEREFETGTATASSITSSSEDHLNIADHPVQDLLLMLSALLQKIVEANDKLRPDHYSTTSAGRDSNGSHSNSNNHHIRQNSKQLHMEQSKYTANVLAFHGRNIPAISLNAYLTRILKYCPVTNEVFLSLLVYFDRIAKRANNGDFNSTFGTTSSGASGENAAMDDDEDDKMADADSDFNDYTDSPSGNSHSNNNKQQQSFVMDSYNIHRLIISGITVASKFFSDVFYKNSRYAKVGGLPLDELNHLELQFLSLLDFKLMIQVEEMCRYGDLLLKFWKREQIVENGSSGLNHQKLGDGSGSGSGQEHGHGNGSGHN